MQHFYSLEAIAAFQTGQVSPVHDALVTIGSFDGVHLGHQAILTPMVQQARDLQVPSVVVTFHPHPAVALRGIDGPLYLTSPEERADLLGRLGIDYVVTLKFDQALASLSAEEFMARLKSAFGLSQLWAGSDFALGRNRQGNIEVLGQIGERQGYSVQITGVVDDGGRISSSRIRELLRAGQAAEAARLLGRPYSVDGPVVHGDGRGRGLGFPTANVQYWPGKIVPAYGVYATWVWIGPRRLSSVTSVGVRPTFDNPPQQPRVEAFILDFDEDIYDQEVRVEFLEFLRPELRFDSVQSLIDQMISDTQNAREVLAHAI